MRRTRSAAVKPIETPLRQHFSASCDVWHAHMSLQLNQIPTGSLPDDPYLARKLHYMKLLLMCQVLLN